MQEFFRHATLPVFDKSRNVYLIESISTKEGPHSHPHSPQLGRQCQILKLDIGERGWLLVDVGDSFPHRIWLSNVIGVTLESDLCIETEHTRYHLRKILQE